jgi:hypothetical protein
VDVTPYDKRKYEPEKGIPVVKAATAYTDNSGATYILILNQALYLSELEHSLLNPNQMRLNSVIMDDCPQHLSNPDRPSTHSIHFPVEGVRIPLEMDGIISRFATRVPTLEELNECQWLSLTGDQEWNPHSPLFNEIMNGRTDEYERPERREIYEMHTATLNTKMDIYADDVVSCNLCSVMSSLTLRGRYDSIKKSKGAELISAGVQSKHRQSDITAERLARLWKIPLKTAIQTIRVTTQRGIRLSIHPLHENKHSCVTTNVAEGMADSILIQCFQA